MRSHLHMLLLTGVVLVVMHAETTAGSNPADCSMSNTFDDVMANGVMHSRSGEHAKALSCFERGVKLRPDNPGAAMYFGESLMRVGRLEEAVAMLEKATLKRPKNAMGFLLLASAAQRIGDTERAKYVTPPISVLNALSFSIT
jgi:predicted Zn-dependent protease